MKTVIAMTREMGSLGKDVAAGIAQRRGGRVVYHEMIDPAADRRRVRRSHVIRLLETGANLWEKLTADSTSMSIFTAEETYRLLLSDDISVIRGWGAVPLMQGISHVVRVRVCAPFELRVARMMKRLGTDDREVVEHEVELADEAHTAIARRHFHVDWRHSEHYDAVLSTERLSVEECVDEVERLMRLPRFAPTPASERVLRARALEWSIRATLRRDPRTAGAQLSIQCNDGQVRLSGPVDGDEQSRAVVDAVRALPGVAGVHLEPTNLQSTASLRAEAELHRERYLRRVKTHAGA